MAKLVDGNIPANTTCPFYVECGLKRWCEHKGEKHPTSFSCDVARGFETIERCKKIENKYFFL